MSATANVGRDDIQSVIRRVVCPRCRAEIGAPCFSGRQKDGKYLKTVPESHVARWRAATDAGHVPTEAWDPLAHVDVHIDLTDAGEHPPLHHLGHLR